MSKGTGNPVKRKKTLKERDFHARATFYGVGLMDKKGVKVVGDWLRALAKSIEKNPQQYSEGRFNAKLMK